MKLTDFVVCLWEVSCFHLFSVSWIRLLSLLLPMTCCDEQSIKYTEEKINKMISVNCHTVSAVLSMLFQIKCCCKTWNLCWWCVTSVEGVELLLKGMHDPMRKRLIGSCIRWQPNDSTDFQNLKEPTHHQTHSGSGFVWIWHTTRTFYSQFSSHRGWLSF